MKDQNNWQSAINSQLSQRLIRPLIQPGIISFADATEIIQRSQRFSSRHPLLNNPRWSSLKHLEGEKVPIVHAQMTVPKESEVQQTGVKIKETPVVQAKRVIEGKQAFESHNKVDYPQSQHIHPTAIAADDSNLVIQRKLDSSAPQSYSQTTSSPSTPSHHNGEESLSLDGEIYAPVIPTTPVSDLVVPTSPLLPQTETVFSQQQSNTLPIANSSSQNLSNSDFISQDTDVKQLSSKNIELSRKHNQQQVSSEENSQFLSQITKNISDGETAEVINTLPVVKSSKRIVNQENNLTQLGKNELGESSTAINSLLPVVHSRTKLYSDEANSTERRKQKKLDYPGQKEEKKSGKVDMIVESSPKEIRDEKLILKEFVQARTEPNYSDTITVGQSSNLASNFNSKKTNQANILPRVQPKVLTSYHSSSIEESYPSQSQSKSVVVNPQQRKSPEMKTPLIFSKGAIGQQTQENNNKRQISQPNNYPSATNNLSQPRTSETVVNQWLVNQNQQNYPDSQSQQKIDLNAITNQVERRLKRRLIAESERRGRKFR